MSLEPNRYYVITHISTGQALDLSGSVAGEVIGYPYHGGTNQQWRLEGSGGRFKLVCKSSGEYVYVAPGTTTTSANATTGSSFSFARFTAPGDPQWDGAYQMASGSNSLEVASSGSRVVLAYTDFRNPYPKLWRIVPVEEA